MTEWLRSYGLLSLFVGTIFEGEGILLTAGGLAHAGILSIGGVWVVGAFGAFMGHILFFCVGRYSKDHIIVRFPRLKPKIDRAMPIIKKHPWLSIFILQYLYGMRIVGAIALGLSGMSWRIFIGIEALNCLIWAAIISALGFAMTGQMLAWYHATHRGLWIVVLIGLLLALSLFIGRNYRRRRRSRG